MAISLNRLSIGMVGVEPGIVFMVTEENAAAIQVPGFLNNGERFSEVEVNPADFIFTSLNGRADLEIYVPHFDTDGIITLVPIAGDSVVPPSFSYLNTFFVAKGGSDVNSGTDSNNPKLTFQSAIDAAAALGNVANVRNVIVCNDSGTYEDDLVLSHLATSIFAPNATLANCTFTLSANTGSTTSLYGNAIVFKNWNSVSYTDTSGFQDHAYDTVSVTVDSVRASDMTVGARNTNISFNFWDVTDSEIACNNGRTNISFNILETNSSALGADYNPLVNLDLESWTNVSGMVGKVNVSPGSISSLIIDQAVDERWVNSVVRASPSGNITLLVTTSFNNIVPIGWETMIVRAGGSGNVRLDVDAGLTRICQQSAPETAGDGGYFILRKVNTNVWFVGGGVQNRNGSSTFNVYVSALNGSDTDGTGDAANPYATIGAAITAIGAPTNKTNVVILDDEIYNEQVVIGQGNINLIGPTATLRSTAGDSLSITTSGSSHLINLYSMGSSAGLSIVTTGSSSVAISVDSLVSAMGNGNISHANGTMTIRAGILEADVTVTGTGEVDYIACKSSGTNTAGAGSIKGLYPTGASGSFNVKGTLRVSNAYNLPATDGTAGQVLTTDGLGGVTWA